MELGELLRQVRIMHLKQKQKDFSKAIGVAQTYVSQIEKGKRYPSVAIMKKISNHIGIDVVVLQFLALTEESIDEDKRNAFKVIKPHIDALVRECFFIGDVVSSKTTSRNTFFYIDSKKRKNRPEFQH